MIAALSIILCCQLAGEIAARASGLPVPGPVIGILLLLAILLLRDRFPRLTPRAAREGEIEAVSGVLLAHLSLLFVPAGVGVIQRLDVLGAHWPALAAALAISSILGLVATAFVFDRASRRRRRP